MNGTTILGNVQYEPFGPLASWTWGSGASMTRSYDLDGRPGAIDSAGNRLTSTTGALARTYSYDAAGNTTGYGNLSFSWGDAGRMASATASGTTTSYLYNGLGERVGKSSPGATRIYLHDEAGHLLGTYDGAGALIEEYLWLDDTPVALLRPAGADTTVYYLHTDHLATPIRLTRASDNLVVWRWDADPFGSLAPAEDPDGDTLPLVFNLRFPGQYYDSETGLHYNYFRDYDPQVGRYLESDPIGLEGGVNTYSYVGANPISRVDPTGEDYWVEDADPSESGWGQHQSICVGKYGTSNRYCISFGRKPGQGNCLFDCDGHAYQDRSPAGDIVNPMHRKTSTAVDRKIRRYLTARLGEQRPWDVLGGENCRVFSQNLFQQLVKQYGGDAPTPPEPVMPPIMPIY